MLFVCWKRNIVRVGHTPQNTILLRPLRNTVPSSSNLLPCPANFRRSIFGKAGLFLSFIPLPFLPPLFVLFSFCFVLFLFLFLFLFYTWKHNLVITSLKNSFLSSFLFTSLLPHFFITSFLVFFSSFMFISFLWFLNSALQIWSKANNGNPDWECGHSWKCSVLWGVIGFQGQESTVNT